MTMCALCKPKVLVKPAVCEQLQTPGSDFSVVLFQSLASLINITSFNELMNVQTCEDHLWV